MRPIVAQNKANQTGLNLHLQATVIFTSKLVSWFDGEPAQQRWQKRPLSRSLGLVTFSFVLNRSAAESH